MGQYAGNNIWLDNVYQFEETDVVQGGPGGIDNKPLQDLADRTQFLKNKLGIIQNFDGYQDLNNGATVTDAQTGKLICAFAAGATNLVVADASTFKHGAILPITSFCNPDSVVTFSF